MPPWAGKPAKITECGSSGLMPHTATPSARRAQDFFALGSLVQRIYEEQAHRVHWKSTRKGALDAPHRDVFQAQSSQEQADESAGENENSETQTGELIPELSLENAATPIIPDLPEGLNLAFIPLAEPLDATAESLVSRGEMRIRQTNAKLFTASSCLPSRGPSHSLPQTRPWLCRRFVHPIWCLKRILMMRFRMMRS